MSNNERDTLEQAKKVWGNSQSWQQLSDAGLENAAADFIISFSSLVKSMNVKKMIDTSRKWQNIPPEKKLELIQNSKERKKNSAPQKIQPEMTPPTQFTPLDSQTDISQPKVTFSPLPPASVGHPTEQVPILSTHAPNTEIRIATEMVVQSQIETFRDQVMALLRSSPDFDPRNLMPNSDVSYLKKAKLLKEFSKELFQLQTNKAATIWGEISHILSSFYERIYDLDQEEFPRYESNSRYIQARIRDLSQLEVSTESNADNPDVQRTRFGPATLFCAAAQSSFDAYGDSEHGQDAVGLREIFSPDGETLAYRLIQTDGVGQSFQSENLARAMVKFLIEADFTSARWLNLFAMGHQSLLSMEEMQHLPQMVQESLFKTMSEAGSKATVNQLMIDTKGNVAGTFRGDGVLCLIQNGNIQTIPFGNPRDTIGTARSNKVTVLTLEEIVGHPVVLQPGDALLLSSDGLLHENKIDKIAHVVATESNESTRQDSITQIILEAEKSEDDDKSLIIFQQPNTS